MTSTKKRRITEAPRDTDSEEEMETEAAPNLRKIQAEEKQKAAAAPAQDERKATRPDNNGANEDKENLGKIPPVVLNKAEEWTLVSRRL